MLKRILPLVNSVVSVTALTYQINVMNPSNKEISLKIDRLESKIDKKLNKK
jgi:hypothetical protein